ncbi:MAG: DUF892 family protein, partial [Saprospiraceae bacterium]
MKSAEIKSDQTGTQKNGMTSHGNKAKYFAAHGLRNLFEAELKDIYWAEKELVKAIPKIIEKLTSDVLAEVLTGHLKETKKHVKRLEKVFTSIGVIAQAKKCEAMVGLLKKVCEIMESSDKDFVRNTGIISAWQKIKHYEIATYGTLCILVTTLDETEAASLLEETLNEEKA